jgi:hypothetical protein
MKYQSLEELRALAIVRTAPLAAMSREEKLRRWADVLGARGGSVASLYQTEYVSRAERAAMRADGSAISVAYVDPMLREEGLAGDAYGDAVAFFALSDTEMHRILCFCTGGHSLTAEEVARRIRAELRAPGACVASMWVVSAVAVVGVALAAAF